MKNTVKISSRKMSRTDGLTMPQSGLIYAPLMEDPGMEKWISSLEDSHANRFLWLEKVKELKKEQKADSGSKCSGSSKKQTPNTYSSKTSQGSAIAVSIRSLKDYPKMGLMLNGLCSELMTSEPPTKEKDGSVSHGNENWRTPHASDGEGGIMEMREGTTGHYKLRDHVMPLNSKFWPTVRSSEYKDCGPIGSKSQKYRFKKSYLDATVKESDCKTAADMNMKLSPDWTEWLMGYPAGYSDILIEKSKDFIGWDLDPADLPSKHIDYIPRITDRKDLRKQRLKCLGNAVVPQQAMAAWNYLFNNKIL